MQNHRNSGFVINIGKAVFFLLCLWEVGQCQKMCSALSGKRNVLKYENFPYEVCSLCSVKTTQSGRQMTVTGPVPENLPF